MSQLLLQAGVLVTLLLGLFNLYFNLRSAKRAQFINTVTSERIKWIASVRGNMAHLLALCDKWQWHKTQQTIPELQQSIERIRSELKLQLNPKDVEDQDIERLLSGLPSWDKAMDTSAFTTLRSALVEATQRLLKREWDKVKEESLRGDLRSRRARRGDA